MSEPARISPRWWLLTGVLAAACLTTGCSPGTLGWLLYSVLDDKIKPLCPIAHKKEEKTVVILASFNRGEIPFSMESAAPELADLVAVNLRKRYADNKEKVKIVAPGKVRAFMNNRDHKGFTERQIGAHFKADYVISLDIGTLTLRDPGSQIFKGRTEINVSVDDVKAPPGEERIFSQPYQRAYPNTQIIEIGGASPAQFRTVFLNAIAKDLSRWFAAHEREDRFVVD